MPDNDLTVTIDVEKAQSADYNGEGAIFYAHKRAKVTHTFRGASKVYLRALVGDIQFIVEFHGNTDTQTVPVKAGTTTADPFENVRRIEAAVGLNGDGQGMMVGFAEFP